MKYTDNAVDLLNQIFDESEVKRLVRKLKDYNINTVEQLNGALNPILPDISKKEAENKALSSSFFRAKVKISKPAYKRNCLKQMFEISHIKAKEIETLLKKIEYPQTSYKLNNSVWSLGLMGSKEKIRQSFWNNISKGSFPDEFLIPSYEEMGVVYDQGRRGTCVANACCSLLDYLSVDKTSRQFLYHQCKMTDQWSGEGTYIHVAMKIAAEKDLIDYGIVEEKTWRYNPSIGMTPHQGPPPENCYSSSRYTSNLVVYPRQSSIINDIKTLLTGVGSYKPVPVVIGVATFPSFQNQSSNRTGWITMPLPGESSTSGHAMVIVGYFEKEKYFLVRNSWGTSWAYDNPYGYPGHALIPYKYIEKYCDSSATLIDVKREMMYVPPTERLYNRNVDLTKTDIKGQTISRSKKRKPTRKAVVKLNNHEKLFWSFLGSVFTLGVIYFNEIAEFLIGLWEFFD